MNAPLSTEEQNADYAAYPSAENCTKGLTKRELFAAMAMQGMLAAEAPDEEYERDRCATRAVQFADALLTALDGVTK